jgi:arginyl-tRNA synthetase
MTSPVSITSITAATKSSTSAIRSASAITSSFGEKITLGDDDYHGEDIIKIAEELKEKYGDKYLKDSKETHDFFIQYGIEAEFTKIKKDLADFGVHFDKLLL